MARLARLPRILVLPLLGAILAASPAGAELPPPPDYADAIRSDFMRRDLRLFGESLDLDADQNVIVEQLYSDFETSMKLGVKELQRRIVGNAQETLLLDDEALAERERLQAELAQLLTEFREIRTAEGAPIDQNAVRRTYRERATALQERIDTLGRVGTDPAGEQRLYRAMEQALDRWRRQKDTINQDFTDGVRALLTDEQATRWPDLERRLARHRMLPRGRFSGESVNLLLIATQAGFNAPLLSIAQPILDEYEIALHEALLARRDRIGEAQDDFEAALANGDQAAARNAYERRIAAHIAVRDVNDGFAGRIAEALPLAPRHTFLKLYRERGYPRVFRSTTAERMFKSAAESATFDAATKEAVQQLFTRYLGELAVVNETLLETVRKQEPVDAIQRLAQRWPDHAARGATAGGQINQAFAARTALDNQYVDLLQVLLGNEQFATLPGARAAELKSRPRPEKPGWETVLAKFDMDGDGQLTGDERRRAEEFLSRRDRPQPRPLKGAPQPR